MRFNLIDEAWLPCLMPSGLRRETSLQDALQGAHTFGELRDESPLVTAALHRLLLAVLHRVFGPSDMFKWRELWDAGAFPRGPLKAYFDRWRDRFDLFHEHWPFYQTGGMTTEKPLPVSALYEELATGNNATLFDHTTESSPVAFTPAQSARGLVMRQAFALGLGVSPAVTIKGKTMKTGHRQDGPLARGVVLLVKGESLFHTLMLNLCVYQGSDSDLPIWECDNPEAQVNKTKADGRLDLYTAQCRRLRLDTDNAADGRVRWVHFAQGRKLLSEYFDPMKAYQIRNKAQEPSVIGLIEDRVLWRDSTALFELARRHRPGEHELGASALQLVATAAETRCLSHGIVPQIDLLGLATQRGKATSVVLWRHESLPLPIAYLGDDKALLGDLKSALILAEAVATALRQAVRSASRVALSPGEPNKADKDRVTQMTDAMAPHRLYWSRLEEPFRRLIVDLPGDAAHRLELLRNWFAEPLRTAAHTAYDSTAGTLESNARALRAAVTGRQRLDYELAKIARKYDFKKTPNLQEAAHV